MNSRETLFAGLAGLRGSVSLILAQAVVTEDKEGQDSTAQVTHTWTFHPLPPSLPPPQPLPYLPTSPCQLPLPPALPVSFATDHPD